MAWLKRGTRLPRAGATAIAIAFALAVGASRVYLGDRYPTDILGSYLTVSAAVLLVWAVTDLPPVRRAAARLLRTPQIAPPPRRATRRTPRQHADSIAAQ